MSDDVLRSLHQPEECAPAWSLLAVATEVFAQDNPLARGMRGMKAEARLRRNLRELRDATKEALVDMGAPVPWEHSSSRYVEDET